MPAFTPQNPNYRASVEKLFEATPMHNHLGIRLSSIEPGRVVACMEMHQSLTQQHGAFHAGALITLADAVAGCAAWSLIGKGENLVSISINTSLVRMAQAKRVMAEGWVVKAGSKFYFCQAEVYDESDSSKKPLIAASIVIGVV
ncbi:MAG: PaaI family thioesterase [candidate division Zixibacteria bacterium]|nr:PaaI family thioesterase [candidate division Zixibacteria bacterium]